MEAWPQDEKLSKGMTFVENHLKTFRSKKTKELGMEEPSWFKDMFRIDPTKTIDSSTLKSIDMAHTAIREDARRVIPILLESWASYISRVKRIRGPNTMAVLVKVVNHGVGATYLFILTVILPRAVQHSKGGDLVREYKAIGVDNQLFWPTVHTFSAVEKHIKFAYTPEVEGWGK